MVLAEPEEGAGCDAATEANVARVPEPRGTEEPCGIPQLIGEDLRHTHGLSLWLRAPW
jgi:hypothetical protein